jgi:hypothetical protein
LRKLHALAIEQGVVPPPNDVKRNKIKGLGSRNHRRAVREELLAPL